MPDLRDDLGRLADFVGEPGTFRNLEAARRRRERRRRTAGLIGGGVPLVAALAITFVLVGQPSGSNAIGDSPAPSPGAAASPTVWPEDPINGASADDVQAALDAGDDSLAWRTDPEEVVQRFGHQILGRSMRIMSQPVEVGDGIVVQAWPCPPGERPIGLSCDELQGDPLSFRLVQPAARGATGIWSVESVTSTPLVVTLGAGANEPIAEGDQVTFDVSQLDDATAAHVGIVATNGCNVLHATDDVLANGPITLRVPELYQASPKCAASPGGYAYAYVSDDTTLPSLDPINEPTAVEYPWITIVPFALNADALSIVTPTPEPTVGEGSGTSSASASPDPTAQQATVASITCDGSATRVEGDGTVAAMADGVHLHVENVGGDTQFNIADAAKNVDIASGRSVDLVQPLDPGEHFVLCGLDGGTFTQKIEVVDPSGYWFDADPDCSADESTSAERNSGPLGVEGDPTDEILAAADSIFESDLARSALEGGYGIRTGGYPDQAGERSVVAVDTDGHVIGVVWFRESNADWYPTNYMTCDANVFF